MKNIRKNRIELEKEIQKAKHLMENNNMAIVNHDNLGGIWSADYHVNKEQGKKPYSHHKYNLAPIINDDMSRVKGYSLSNEVYLTPDNAEELNGIGEQIQNLIDLYNTKFEEYSAE